MTKKKRQRMILAAGAFAAAAAAIGLTLTALKGSVTYFYTPGDLAALEETPSRAIRLGGLVAEGSLRHDGATAHFTVTDGAASVAVSYAGILPDLFREGQGVIAQGRLSDDRSSLVADNVLAKHDENYMPKEVAEALKEKGVWQSDSADARGE